MSDTVTTEKASASPLEEICGQLAAHRLPRWEELPDLELYKDGEAWYPDHCVEYGWDLSELE